ncbi:MAG: acyl-CoA thioesterase [Planctomycetota bacterium]|jgi:acyl-CoA thioester hydrolase|nr:acyl-CoA thioesterase [Planctomycetota bacterium]
MWKKVVTPGFGDIDGLRHINNCMLPVWFELGREPLFRLFHPDLSLENWQLIMARISVDFVAQMRLGADIAIHTFVGKIGRSSTTVYQEAWQKDRLGAKGEAVVVYYDFKNEESLPIPEAIRDQLAKHALPTDHPAQRKRSGRFTGNPKT